MNSNIDLELWATAKSGHKLEEGHTLQKKTSFIFELDCGLAVCKANAKQMRAVTHYRLYSAA